MKVLLVFGLLFCLAMVPSYYIAGALIAWRSGNKNDR